MGSAIGSASPPEAFHELRKKGKELRYLLELFGSPLYPSEVVKPMIKALKALQDVLGRHQDRRCRSDCCARCATRSPRPGGPAALMAMGVLVQRLGEDERRPGETSPSDSMRSRPSGQRKLVKDTFA